MKIINWVGSLNFCNFWQRFDPKGRPKKCCSHFQKVKSEVNVKHYNMKNAREACTFWAEKALKYAVLKLKLFRILWNWRKPREARKNVLFYVEIVQNMTYLVNKDTYRHKDTEVWKMLEGQLGGGKKFPLGKILSCWFLVKMCKRVVAKLAMKYLKSTTRCARHFYLFIPSFYALAKRITVVGGN